MTRDETRFRLVTGVCSIGQHHRCSRRFVCWDGERVPCQCWCHPWAEDLEP